jgi:hypothetical protein
VQNVLHFPPGMKLADLQADHNREDLIYFTNSMIDSMLDLVRDLPDAFVTYMPDDPQADDPWAATDDEKAISWTLGHVIVHTTASSEERTSHGSMLARGTQIKGRNRYEVPWETITTTAQIVQRLEESRRMRLAFLDTWPDDPQLDNVYDQKSYVDAYGPLNAVGMTLMGLKHDAEHLPQIAEIVRQAQEACVAC